MEPNHPDERRSAKRSYWRLFRTFAIFMLIVALAVGSVAYFQVRRAQGELDERFAALREAGYPTTLEELNAFDAEPAGEDSATPYLVQFARLWKETDSGFTVLNRLVQVARGEDGEAPTAEQLAEAEAFLASQDEAIAALYQATDRPGLRFDVEYSADPTVPMDHLTDLRSAARVLELIGVVAVYDNYRTHEAVNANARMLELAHGVGNEPLLISQMVSMAIYGLAVDNVMWILNNGKPNNQLLRRLNEMYAEGVPIDHMRRGFAGEMAYSTSLAREAVSASPPVIRTIHRGWMDYETMLQLRYMDWVVMAPFDDWSDVYAEMKSRPDTIQEPSLLAKYLIPNVQRSVQSVVITATKMRLAYTAIAVEQAFLEDGTLPESLNGVKRFMPAGLPLDPFDGEPVRYVKTEDGFSVYSVFTDGEDDKAKATSRPFASGDLVLSVTHATAAAKQLQDTPED